MIETERLILRPLSPQDEEAFIRAIADDELRRMYGFPAELSEDTARRILVMLRSLPEDGRTLAFATFPPYQRQGYMREALTVLMKDRFRANGVPYLHCGHFPGNEPSQRLLRALGFMAHGQHALGKATIIDEIRFPK